jgi:undecaprenyl pyrophosphate synthase
MASVPRALLAAHVVALLRDRLRASPSRSSTAISVVVGTGGRWNIVDVRLIADEIVLVARPREKIGRPKPDPEDGAA